MMECEGAALPSLASHLTFKHRLWPDLDTLGHPWASLGTLGCPAHTTRAVLLLCRPARNAPCTVPTAYSINVSMGHGPSAALRRGDHLRCQQGQPLALLPCECHRRRTGNTSFPSCPEHKRSNHQSWPVSAPRSRLRNESEPADNDNNITRPISTSARIRLHCHSP